MMFLFPYTEVIAVLCSESTIQYKVKRSPRNVSIITKDSLHTITHTQTVSHLSMACSGICGGIFFRRLTSLRLAFRASAGIPHALQLQIMTQMMRSVAFNDA